MLHRLPDADRIGNWIAARVEGLDSEDARALFRVFREYFWRVRARLALIVVMIAIMSAATAGVALMVKDLVNVIFVEQSADFALLLTLLAMAIFTVRGLATYYQNVLSARISNEIVADVQKRLFQHVLRQRMAAFSKYSSDHLLMAFNQGASGFGSILTNFLINGVRDGAQVAALVAVMLYQDVFLTFACLMVGPPVYYGVVKLLAKIRGLMEQELAGYSQLYKRVREMVQGITVIKSFNLETPAYESGSEVVEGLRDRLDRIAGLQAAPLPLMEVAGGIAVGVAILYAGIRVSGGDYDAGTFMSFLTSLLLAADPARRLSQLRVTLKTSFVAVGMVYSLLADDQPEQSGDRKLFPHREVRANGGAPPPPAIEFDNVGFAYAVQSPVLTGFDLDVPPGEMVALVGPSGAGKSTVFKLLLKFYEPSTGAIRINGTDLSEIDTKALRDMMAYVGQANFMFGGSFRDNLSLMDRAITQRQIEEACALVGLEEFIAGLPQGYDTDVGELGAFISGGQAQRVNLARAIIKNSPILLLDEVTSALDAENEHLVKNAIRQMSGTKTVLVIAHRLSTVREAERIALMRDGQIVASGRHEDLLKTSDYYEKIVSLQFA